MAEPNRRQSKRLLQNASLPKTVISTRQAATQAKPTRRKATEPKAKAKAKPNPSATSPKPPQTTTPTQPRLLLPSAPAWRAWLDAHESTSTGVWLVLAKKGTTSPTSLTRQQALDEALCSGWIDSQAKSLDAATSLQRFTPRRKRSLWSAVNVRNVARLRGERRMRERGEMEVARAVEDGRWGRAYEGPKGMGVPGEVERALEGLGLEGARERLAGMTSMQRYAALLPVVQAQSEEVRRRRVERLVEELVKGG